MRDLVEDGVAPAEAARVVLGPARVANDAPGQPGALELAQARLLAATDRWDVAAIDGELTHLSMLLDAQSLFEGVISPVLTEVGLRWERGDLSIAQEHLLTERLEHAVRACLRGLERPFGPVVVLGCVDADRHVIGALGAALRFAQSGARTVLLGAATPPPAIAEAVANLSPRLVGLSMTVVPPRSDALFQAYGEACGATPWVVGGAAADELRAAIERAGGRVAVGSSSAWNDQIREWLRGAR
jgi:hypothetical protein